MAYSLCCSSKGKRTRVAMCGVLGLVLSFCSPFLQPLSAEAVEPPAEVASPELVVSPELRQRSIDVIRGVLKGQERWVKVHAAEYLLALDYVDGVKEAFLAEEKLHGADPEYRIGIWRVLARTANSEEERKNWIDKIRQVIGDPKAPDRLHAVETFAKLQEPATDDEIAVLKTDLQKGPSPMPPLAAWVLLNSGQADAESQLVDMLDNSDSYIRSCAAYALRLRPFVSPATAQALAAKAKEKPADSSARASLLGAAAVHGPKDVRDALKPALIEIAKNGAKDDRYEAAQALAQIGDKSDLPMLSDFLEDPNPDIAATAANAILRVERRTPHRLALGDWIVIGLYALGMLSVGFYYSRRTKTREEYLLGNRQMRPTMVGLSLFAALISTISYLALPGEVIKYGPVFISYLLVFPFIGLVVGWLLIPFIMRMKVTSAYEILEVRLGPVARTIGSVLFLLLRLFWMAVIVYATTSKVLVPLLGLEPWTTPIVCSIMALLAITYTTMGGLRAAVLTDVIQTGILITAAIVTIVVISVSLGGVGAWWPKQWPAYWPKVEFYSSTARMTIFGTMLATFIWHVCTSASDQIAVQRYLSTRDAKAARTVLFITLGADGLVATVLATVGLGLLAYFWAFPHLLPDGMTVLGDSDKLFAQYIVIGLPEGVSGLVMAGLLACAMSSLAAGINSTCSVITVDFIDRIRHQDAKTEAGHVSQLRHVSLWVGVVVVLLSMLVYMVPGNLLEVCYKVVNLLTAPLGGLFFIAMFIPWARSFGAIVAVILGTATAVLVSYWPEVTGVSWIWAMPLSLAVEVAAGALFSLIPIGRCRPMVALESEKEG